MKLSEIRFKLFFTVVLLVPIFLLSSTFANAQDSWRIYPPSGMSLFPLAGKFTTLPPAQTDQNKREKSWKRAEMIVSDPIFMVNNKSGRYNLWASLEKFEGNFRTDQVPHGPCNIQKSFEYLTQKYGSPDFVGAFRYRTGKQDKVYWFGPIFLMVDNKGFFEMGGWPSRIGQPHHSPKSILPSYDFLLLNGQNLVKIKNPNSSGVTYGIRSKDQIEYSLGFDSYLKANAMDTVHLQPGNYDLFLIYDEKPNALFQGDSFNIKTSYNMQSGTKATSVDIILKKVVGGNYPIHRIK